MPNHIGNYAAEQDVVVSKAGQMEAFRHGHVKPMAVSSSLRQRLHRAGRRLRLPSMILVCAIFNASVWYGLVGAIGGNWFGPFAVGVGVGAFLLTVLALSLLAIATREPTDRRR